MDHLIGLNDAQRAAVLHVDGPNMVIAGAGSGKTRVLTVRIAHLMAAHGVDPFRILALTFTNKAAREMKDRIAGMVGHSEAANLWMGTFHSVFARVLRAEGHKLGYPRDFTIYDTDDSRNVIKGILKEWQLDDKVYKPSQVHNRISICKNNLIGPEEYLLDAELMAGDTSGGRDKLGQIYAAYSEKCFRAGAMDFDDLLLNTALLFRDHPEAMLKYQERFQYILVDEYQDTNLVQYQIIRTLAARHENITVVGDDSQSIYSFRGANIQNILNFRKDHEGYALFKLEQNYRSTKNIVGAANSLIDRNKDQIKKTIWTENPEGEKIHVHRTVSDNEEGSFVAHSIFETKMQNQVPNKGFAILYRTNAQSRAMEEALRKLNIPYRIYGGLSFYQRKEIKDLLAYMRLTCNPRDDEALRRIINYPIRGIGQTTVEKVMVQAAGRKIPIWDLLMQHSDELDLHGGMRKHLADFVLMIRSFQTMLTTTSAYALGEHVARSTGILKDLFSDKTPEGISRYDNIQELLNAMKEFSDGAGDDAPRTLPDFLIDVALLTDADKDTDDPADNDRVSLMTVHSAKGLEFEYVYVVGLEEDLFPNLLAVQSRADLEEERRLFYVALTRARTRASLSYAASRYRWGNLTSAEPSRCIDELDATYLELPSRHTTAWRDDTPSSPPWKSRSGSFGNGSTTGRKPAAPAQARTTAIPSARKNLKRIAADGAPVEATSTLGHAAPEDLVEGVTVEHDRFGKGKVIKIEGKAPDLKATVFFPAAGQKQLLLRFAKLRVIEA